MSDNKSRTVLFYGVNTPGHVNFLLALADKLKADCNFRTVFVLLGSPVDDSIKRNGHELVILEETSGFEVEEDSVDGGAPRKVRYTGYMKYERMIRSHLEAFTNDPIDGFGWAMKNFVNILQSEILDNHAQLEATFSSINPDLVICDLFWIPPVILKQENTPWIKVCSANPLGLTRPVESLGVQPPALKGIKLLDKETRAKLREEKPDEWKALLETWRKVGEEMHQMRLSLESSDRSNFKKFYEEHGLPQPPVNLWGQHSPYINIYLFPEAIDYDQEDDILEYPKNWFRCDSLIRKPSQSNLEALKFWSDKLNAGMKGKKEMVYFSLGSLASGNVNNMKKYVEVFSKDKNRLYVISKGPAGEEFELESSNMIGDNYIPQTFFLEKANLAIVHGGNNGIFECLYYGVPMIVIPMFGDQNDNAQRIEDLGLGRRLESHGSVGSDLTMAINEVLSNNAIIEKARSVGQKMRAKSGSTKVSQVLKKLIEDKKLDQDMINSCRSRNIEDIPI